MKMNKYGKFASAGLFVILGIFILLQYQNCGNSSTTSNSSAVGPSGLTYTVTLTPQAPTVSRNTQTEIVVQVQSSGPELMGAIVGYEVNGVKNPLCNLQSQGGPSEGWTNPSCRPSFSQDGTYNLYVDVIDTSGQFPPNEFMIDCSPPLVAGCQGTYTINVTN